MAASSRSRTMKGKQPAKKTSANAAKKKTATRRRPATAKPESVTANGMLLVSVFGPAKNRRALVEMSVDAAAAIFGKPLSPDLAPAALIDATTAEVEEIAKRAPKLKNSALAATAVALAYEIADPFNSATSKSLCARELRETMTKLRDLAPPAEEEDGIDDLAARRAARRGAAA